MSFGHKDIITIKSPIDVHAHLREPGGELQETIRTGTSAALAGGYQAVFDMPNNPNDSQTWSEERLDDKISRAEQTSETNIGFYAGVDLDNPAVDELHKMIGKAAGLKLYMGHTTGNKQEHDLEIARPVIDAWTESAGNINEKPPILLHAREEVGEETARYIALGGYPVHWCHVSTSTEVQGATRLTDEFKEFFTAGVTPHHLTMTGIDADFKYGWNGARMMPPLGKEVDHEALVAAFNSGYLQILETDHAPHTATAKFNAESKNPEGNTDTDCTTCFGVSGIEFVLPVMMSLVKRKVISMERLEDALYTQPARMLGLDTSGNTAETEISLAPYVIGENDRVGKSTNNPYVGWTAWGKVVTVTMNGVTRFRHQTYRPEFKPKILRVGEIV